MDREDRLQVAQPANSEGRFFADNFERRTGKPLEYVTGDARIAPLVALGAAQAGRTFTPIGRRSAVPGRAVTDMREHGGLLVWPAGERSATPPATLKAQFPDLVAEVPRSFPRAVQGFLPLIRLGWAVVRPPLTPQRYQCMSS